MERENNGEGYVIRLPVQEEMSVNDDDEEGIMVRNMLVSVT
jgi:hypothetical protein